MKNKFLSTINNIHINKKTVLYSMVLVAVLVIIPEKAYANWITDPIIIAVGVIISLFAAAMGKLLIFLIWIMTEIAQYSDFVNTPTVKMGWLIVRDLCNMFFVLVLLAIAFATILRVESYNAKRLLPKLLIMAVLINFSKTICGLIIDFAQIIILTFVAAFADGGGTAFVDSLKINSYLEFSNMSSQMTGASSFDIILGLIMGTIAILVAMVVVVVLGIILLMRMIMIWVYVILSPLAFLLSSFPGGQSYASRWWSGFIKEVIVGPVLAFFIWLAMATTSLTVLELKDDGMTGALVKAPIGNSELFQDGNFQTYMITIALLIGGLMITQQVGAAAGGAAGRGIGVLNKGKQMAGAQAMRPVRAGGRKLKTASIAGAKASGRVALTQVKLADQFIGRRVSGGKMQGGLVATGLQKSNLKQRWRKASDSRREGEKASYAYTMNEQAINTKYDDKIKNNKTKTGKRRHENERKSELAALTMSVGDNDFRKAKNGQFYKVGKEGDSKGKYTDESGKVINSSEVGTSGVRAQRIGVGGKANIDIAPMSASAARRFASRDQVNSGARSAQKTAEAEKITEFQNKIAVSDMTPQQMMERIKVGSTSDEEKMALALAMAIKDGFKGMDHEDVKTARDTFGGNQILTKEFDGKVNEKYGHLRHDLDSDEGRANFKKDIMDGKISADTLHENAFSDERVMKGFQSALTASEFTKTATRVGNKSQAHKEKMTIGLSGLTQTGTEENKKGARKATFTLTNDMSDAFRGVDVANMSDKDLSGAVNDILTTIDIKELAKMKTDNLDEEKMGKALGSAEAGKAMVKAVEKSIAAMGQRTVEQISRHATQELTNKFSKLIEGGGGGDSTFSSGGGI